MEQNELEKMQEDIARKRRIKIQALAIIKRSVEAGIPDDMRIGKDGFRELLDEKFHNGKSKTDDLAENIFNKADLLFKHPFIIIDGGNRITRTKCGFSLLFRMIACDKSGKYESFSHFTNTLSTFTKFGVARNEYNENMANYDVLFLSEFERLTQIYNNVGSYIDETFEKRHYEHKPTIISFVRPLNSREEVSRDGILDDNLYGQYLPLLSKIDMDGTIIDNVLRIRVKSKI